jgi:hypothetical protein
MLPGLTIVAGLFVFSCLYGAVSSRACVVQILRERVATGRKLVEAISAALPVMPVPVEAPAGHRARRVRSEYGAHRHGGTPEKTAGALRVPSKDEGAKDET